MSEYEHMLGLLERGEISLLSIEAVPRSVSTALGRALNESSQPTIYVNEPFNRMRFDRDQAARSILKVLAQQPVSHDEPTTVITKNMARNISLPIFFELCHYSRGYVWAVREPLVQTAALVTRIVNDLVFEPGAHVIATEELTNGHIELACEFLETGPTSTDYSKTGWEAIGEHYKACPSDIPTVVVDGTEFTRTPATILQGVSQIAGIAFSDVMVDGWTQPFYNANSGYNERLDDVTHAWTRDAASSSGIHQTAEQTIDFERLPSSLQHHLLQVALPTYALMMA